MTEQRRPAGCVVRRIADDGTVSTADGRAVGPRPLGPGAGIVPLGRTDHLSALAYVLDDGADDPQPAHDQDEVYVVVAGRATAVIGDESIEVQAGSVLVVPAGRPHRFVDPQQSFTAVAVFAPPLS